MPEWTPETGFEEAQRRIEACAETQSEELDLGGLQLTALPEGLWRLSWLKRLYLGPDEDARNDPRFRYRIDQNRCNALSALSRSLTDALPQLQQLDLSFTRVSDLAPLAGLNALQSLNLDGNPKVSDLAPLAGLTALQTLYLYGAPCERPRAAGRAPRPAEPHPHQHRCERPRAAGRARRPAEPQRPRAADRAPRPATPIHLCERPRAAGRAQRPADPQPL